MELNRNAENVFADVEQAAFSPANFVPGISFSPDKMLQDVSSRMEIHSGTDSGQSQPHSVNAPKCPFHSYHRTGPCESMATAGELTSYEPNRHGNGRSSLTCGAAIGHRR